MCLHVYQGQLNAGVFDEGCVSLVEYVLYRGRSDSLNVVVDGTESVVVSCSQLEIVRGPISATSGLTGRYVRQSDLGSFLFI